MSDWLEVIALMESIVFPSIRERRNEYNANMARQFNKSHRMVSFPIGSYVMARDPTRENKLSPIYEGPFRVVKRTRGGSYQLMDHDGTLLARAHAPFQLVSVPGPALPPLISESAANIFIVESIIDHRRHGRSYEYLVSWKGFDPTHNSWEPAVNFFDIQVITNYWKSIGSK